MHNNVLISVFTLNVSEFIEGLFLDLKINELIDYHIICLNNNSQDDTLKVINNLKVKMNIKNLEIISHPKNMGYGSNKKVSFDYAVKNNYEKIVFLHGDNQYPASGVNEMLRLLDSNSLVFGSRFLNKESVKENMPKLKYLINPFFTKIINLLSGESYSEYFSGFRGYKVDDIKKIKYKNLSNDFVLDQQMMFEIIIRKLNIAEFKIPTVYGNQISKVQPIMYSLSLFKNIFLYFVLRR
jgi:GT2 family glycosyltransferase